MTIRHAARRFVLFLANAIADRLIEPQGNPGSPVPDDDEPDETSCMRPLRSVLTPEAAAMLVKRPVDNAAESTQKGALDGSLAARGLR